MASTLKARVKALSPPWVVRAYSFMVWNLVIRPGMRRRGMSGVFADHYRLNGWASAESRSGRGSTVDATVNLRSELLRVIADYRINSMIDIPCGDFNWMKEVDLTLEYLGADIVPELIEANQLAFGRDGRSFAMKNLTTDPLPKMDLVFCRDCLIHLSYSDIRKALANIKKSDSTYLLTTTHQRVSRNRDIVTGEYRPISLLAVPFSLPRPLEMIDERSPEPDEQGKSLGLWRVSDLP